MRAEALAHLRRRHMTSDPDSLYRHAPVCDTCRAFTPQPAPRAPETDALKGGVIRTMLGDAWLREARGERATW